jgi:hypothetical protein
MADKTKQWMMTALMVIGLISACASPIVAVTIAAQNGKLAEQKATKDFAFFKGEVNAKLDGLTKGQDLILKNVMAWEVDRGRP